jgi:hypothetical protein
MAEKKYNFVYITTNLINRKQYIGDHSTNNEFDKDVYKGSGILIENAFKKYKKRNFKREILEFFPTKQEAFNAQERYIKEYNTLTPNGYNISPKGGHNVKGCIAEETRKKISVSHIGKKDSIETRRKKSESRKGKSPGNKGKHISKQHSLQISKKLKGRKREKPWPSKGKTYVELYGEEKANNISLKLSNSLKGKNKGKQPWLSKKHKKESIEKMIESHKGILHTEKTKQKISSSTSGEKNGMHGKHHSERTLKILQEKALNRIKIKCHYCNKKTSPAMYKRWHGDNCKLKKITN